MNAESSQFDREQILDLLSELDRRLRARGASAAVFVVGGAAMAALDINPRRTADIDAITRDDVVMGEAHAIADERGLPRSWLNGNASMYMPPLPTDVLTPPEEPGLKTTFADDPFLFATKLIAQRSKDESDVLALARRLNMLGASPSTLRRHIESVYTDADQLEMILGPGEGEFDRLCERAATMLARGDRAPQGRPAGGPRGRIGRGKTTPKSNRGSFKAVSHSAPDIELRD